MKLGFIGAGNMGGAIIRGLIANKGAKAKDIFFVRKNKELAEKMSNELGITACKDTKELAEKCDVVFLAVKPFMFEDVLPECSSALKKKDPIIVSVAAGKSIAKIKEILGYDAKVIRIMPNVNAEVFLSTTAICKAENVSDEGEASVCSLLEKIGTAVKIQEDKFPVFSAIAGCSPAYVYMFIDALAEGALRAGMPKKQALEIAASAVYGSAMLLAHSNKHPRELTDSVCSPAGTTIEGVNALLEGKFDATVMSAVKASIDKDLSMGK